MKLELKNLTTRIWVQNLLWVAVPDYYTAFQDVNKVAKLLVFKASRAVLMQIQTTQNLKQRHKITFIDSCPILTNSAFMT